MGAAEITVGVLIVTRRILLPIILRVVLQKEQHVMRAENWGILNAQAGELEEVLTSGEDEDQWRWVNQQGSGESESMTSGSDDYIVMSIRKKNVMEQEPESRLRFRERRCGCGGKVDVQ